MVASIQWARGVVVAVITTRPGLQELDCQLADGSLIAAIAYTDLVGTLTDGDEVWLNLQALTLGLGTGGFAFVVSPAALPHAVGDGLTGADQADKEAEAQARNPRPVPAVACPDIGTDSGYLVKARYTPLQVVARGVDSPHSPYHDTLAKAESLEGMPVVVADLHSSLPAICAAISHDAVAAAATPPRLAYIMTDGAALPIAFSRTVARLVADGTLSTTITAGQAYGGDLEAVSVQSALLAAKHVAQADIAICVQGPGNLGSDTPWGFSGLAVGDVINAISVLSGRAVGCLRVSGADLRPRHRGLSHHSLTAYGRVALASADLALPQFSGKLAELGRAVEEAARPLTQRHHLVPVSL
ncbi:MAG: DUF3866 family protein, partial [Bifidobacteriaceae bacterium]|nr:DUF3866 family protein [Bifidobacteriaceae bacterium]